MSAPSLDPTTLRWVAAELERCAEEDIQLAEQHGDAEFERMAGGLLGHARGLRGLATRIERKRRKA